MSRLVRLQRRTKYGSVKVKLGGYTFDSKAEASRWQELRLAELAGYIRDLDVHPTYDLRVNGVHVGAYEADFAYSDTSRPPGDQRVVEDVKGVRTREYRLKRALMFVVYGIRILETSASRKGHSLKAVAEAAAGRTR